MSVFQKLFNFIHSRPRASHFKVKDLNVYFKHAVTPSYKLINLEKIDSLELDIEIEDKDYNLIAYITRNKQESDILLGTFETRKEAEQAFNQIKNQLFGGGKSLISIANSIVLIIIYTVFLVGFLNMFKDPSTNGSENISAMNFGNANTGNVNMSDMSKLQKQLLQQALQKAGQQGITGMPGVPNMPNLPNSGSAMNNIVSAAIQQGQNQMPVPEQATTTPQTVAPVQQQASPGDDLLKQIK